jgi:hypothetical protein
MRQVKIVNVNKDGNGVLRFDLADSGTMELIVTNATASHVLRQHRQGTYFVENLNVIISIAKPTQDKAS